MRRYDLNKLGLEVENTRKKRLEVLKSKYQLAKSLGFSSTEARILQFKNEKVIRELAEERRLKQLQAGG